MITQHEEGFVFISIALQEILNRSHAQMVQHPQHALLPIYRRQIYDILNNEPTTRGLRVYEKLAILTAEYVLPLWQDAVLTDILPKLVLEAARQHLQGTLDLGSATQVAGNAWEKLERYGQVSTAAISSQAFHAGQAAVEALFATLGRPPFDNVQLNEDDTDAALDPWCSDPALWAVTAYAGGVWDQQSDANKRREFWEWWLMEAIPHVVYTVTTKRFTRQ